MKFLKKLVTVIAVLFLIYVVMCLFFPSKVKVSRSAIINTSPEMAYNQVNNFHTWINWSYWDNIDPKMVSTFEGPESGVGAKHLWTSENKNVGHGSIMITECKPNECILTDLHFDGMGDSHGGWCFHDTTGGVYVTTYMEIELGFLGRVFPGLMMDNFLGSDFEKTLDGLKKHCETMKISVVSLPSALVIEPATVKEMLYASTKKTTSMQTITADIGNSYMKIGAFMKKEKLNQSGPVFAFYHSYSPDKIEMECAVPIDKEAKGDGEIIVGKMKPGNAVVAHYYGSYEKTGTAHDALNKWIVDNHKKINGSPWEVYVTDPGVEKDTAKWLTEIYYPVE